MKTTEFPKIKDTDKKWYIVDAKDQILGRMCTKISKVLRGKDKPAFSHHQDCGDFVIVINAKKIRVTGNKLESKQYYRHSGYPSGIKSMNLKRKLDTKPEDVIKLAVSGMLPKNRLRKDFLKKLKIYKGEEHPHEAQNPTQLDI